MRPRRNRGDGTGQGRGNARQLRTEQDRNGQDRRQMRLMATLAAGLVLLLAALPAAAQDANPFAAALYVNGRSITNYEIAQRALFMQVVEGPGDHHDEALKALTDEKLELAEAAKYGVKPTDADVKAGMEEFASRAKLTADELVAALQKVGVDPATFRDFVAAGVVWRAVVQGTIVPFVHVTDADVAESRRLSLAHGVPRILLSEIILPASPDYVQQSAPLAEELSTTLKTEADFAAAARKYSASDTAQKGGQLDWIPIANLPQQVVQAVTKLSPGQVSPPVAMPNAIGVFLMRGLTDAPAPPAAQVQEDYAEYLIPGVNTPEVAATVAKLRARAETCNDLYGVAKGQPAQVLTRVTQALPQVPADVAYELAKLDPGEASTTLSRGGNTFYLMLCNRTVTENPPQTTDEIRRALFDAKVSALAEQKLAELRAAAIIRQP